jgi:hypothetical protein
MPLIDLKTNLKSLKFGFDIPGGGSSNQPFVEKPIPAEGESTPGSSPDYLLRQGVLQRIADDETRFFKYFQTPQGLAFIAKQNLLSLTSVETEASRRFSPNQGTYLPTNTLAQLAVNPFGGHLNFLGVDPTGLVGGIRKYEDVIKTNNLLDSNQIPFSKDIVTITGGGFKNRLLGLWWDKQLVKSNNPNILSYKGGPGAAEGIGKTNIRFAVGQRTGINNSEYNTSFFFGTNHKNKYYNSDQSNNIDGKLGVTSFFYKSFPESGIKEVEEEANKNRIKEIQNTFQTPSSAITPLFRYETYTQEQLTQQSKPTTTGQIREDFRKNLRNQPTSSGTYTNLNWETRTNYSISPGSKTNKTTSYTTGRGIELDEINALPLYQFTTGNADKNKSINDLVKFRIASVDNDNPTNSVYMHFRAFIDSFSDSYGAQWSGERYPGRGEEFFRYGGFTRGISLSFTVAAQSKQELIPMYKKLNFLASNTMNDYSDSGYMRAPFIKLTIGGYLYEQFGFLKGINYGWEMAAPFEIGLDDTGGEDTSVKELPHVIRVTGFEFQPIYDFLPQKQKNTYNGNGRNVNSYGPERYIALKADNDNYNNTIP